MPSLPSEQPYNAVWKFYSDAHAREYRLTVIYYSNRPPDEHEAIHDKLQKQAFEWLIGQGRRPDPEKVQIIICRLDQDDEVIVGRDPKVTKDPISSDKVVKLK